MIMAMSFTSHDKKYTLESLLWQITVSVLSITGMR